MDGKQFLKLDKYQQKNQCSQINCNNWLHFLIVFASIALLSSHIFTSNDWAWSTLVLALRCCFAKKPQKKLRRRPDVFIWDSLGLPIPSFNFFYSRLLHLFKKCFEQIGVASQSQSSNFCGLCCSYFSHYLSENPFEAARLDKKIEQTTEVDVVRLFLSYEQHFSLFSFFFWLKQRSRRLFFWRFFVGSH